MNGLTIIIIIVILGLTNLISGAPIPKSIVEPRWGHTATLVNSNIYFIGGRTNGNALETEFLSLDISKTFSNSQPGWFQLVDAVGIPKMIGHTAVKGGINDNQIIIFGGSVDDPATAATDSLYVYDTVSGLLTNPIVPKALNRRYDHSAAVTPSGKMLVYGGMVDQTTGSVTENTLQELWEINTITFDAWVNFPLADNNNSPGLRSGHTASIIDNKMFIIGGMTGDTPRAMNVIYAYNFDTNDWEANIVSGDIPNSRRDHSAVVANKKIIIYGGTDATQSTIYGDVIILDTNAWTWTTQITTNPPQKRWGHSATLVGANMIVAFGRTEISADSNIYILNLINWSWVTQYIPMDYIDNEGTPVTPVSNITNPKVDNPPSTDRTKLYLTIIIVLSIICALLITIIVSYAIYRYIYKQKKNNGTHMVGVPYEANPYGPQGPPQEQTQTIQPPQPQQPPMKERKSRPNLLLGMVKTNKKKHDSVEPLFPTSPSTNPSTPRTNNTSRFSNGSAIMVNTSRLSNGSSNSHRNSNGSGVGSGKNPYRDSNGSGLFPYRKSVTFDEGSPTMLQYSPESEESNQFDKDIEAEIIKDRLRQHEIGISPRPSLESVDIAYKDYRDRRILRVANPSPDEDEEKHEEEHKEEDQNRQGEDDDQIQEDNA